MKRVVRRALLTAVLIATAVGCNKAPTPVSPPPPEPGAKSPEPKTGGAAPLRRPIPPPAS